MKSREAVFKALEEGLKLSSSITGFQYMLIDGKLHSRHSERRDWSESNLGFDSPPSWLNLQTVKS